MYDVYVYMSKNGKCPLYEFMDELVKNGKKAEIPKIEYYINLLIQSGYRITSFQGQKYAKQLTKDIFELRPGRNRVLFVKYFNGKFVLLHAFIKKTQKTPKNEIEKAEKEALDCNEERMIKYGKYC